MGRKDLSESVSCHASCMSDSVSSTAALYLSRAGRNESDALYRHLGLTKAEQAGLDLNFTYLLSGHHVFVETSIFVENWCSFSGKTPMTVMQLSRRNYGQCRLFNSVRLTTNLDGKQKDR